LIAPKWRRGLRAAALMVALGGAGCAELGRVPDVQPADRAALAQPFEAEGRLSVRRGSTGATSQFDWTHDGTTDTIVLTSPLGQTIARLSGGTAGARAEMADGRIETADDWDTLTARTLNLPLPVGGFAAWFRGLPREGSSSTVERDPQHRTALLRQDGWEILYTYPDNEAQRASRLVLRYPDTEPIEVRVVVDRWQ